MRNARTAHGQPRHAKTTDVTACVTLEPRTCNHGTRNTLGRAHAMMRRLTPRPRAMHAHLVCARLVAPRASCPRMARSARRQANPRKHPSLLFNPVRSSPGSHMVAVRYARVVSSYRSDRTQRKLQLATQRSRRIPCVRTMHLRHHAPYGVRAGASSHAPRAHRTILS